MLLDYVMQIIGHRKNFALLLLEQLKLLKHGVRDVGHDALESFFAHVVRKKKPAKGGARVKTHLGGGTGEPGGSCGLTLRR